MKQRLKEVDDTLMARALVVLFFLSGAVSACAALLEVPESSGLAPSAHGFWTITDGRNGDGSGGHSLLFEWEDGGRVARRVAVAARNRDWEDLARFRADGVEWLLIADVGDNGARRKEVQLHLVREPAAGQISAGTVRTVRFRYPGGPRDAEAVAVVPGTWRAIVISKRERPPGLFEVDLRKSGVQEARRIGTLAPLLPPDWFLRTLVPWVAERANQPTGLAFDPGGTLAAICTYDDAYLFRRAPGEGWAAAFARPPQRVELPDIAVYEGIAIADGRIYVSQEGRDGVVEVPIPSGPAADEAP